MYRKIHLRTNPYLIKDGKYQPETRDDIHFNFAKDECCKCHNGTCPIEGLTLADLYFVNVSPNRIMPKEYEPDYCIGMAKKLICGDYQFPVDIQLSSLDGHIICYDGRHRICIAQKLNGEHEFKVPVKVNFIVG